MNFQSLDPELAAKVLLLANLQRNLIQNQNAVHGKTTERDQIQTTTAGQQQITHPLLIPSLNVSSQKISAMLTALTPTALTNTSSPTPNVLSMHQSAAYIPVKNNNATSIRTSNVPPSPLRSNGSSFGWGNRERKMEENWRLQNRSS